MASQQDYHHDSTGNSNVFEESMNRRPRTSQLQTICLESDTDHSDADDPTDITLIQGHGEDAQPPQPPPSAQGKQITLATVNEKVDRLLMKFESFDKRLEKNANKCRKKFMNVQSAHNTVIKSINALSARADTSEDINEETRAMVRECLHKINELTIKCDLKDKSYNTRLESVEKSTVELGTEVKEKKLIISGIKEEKGENVRQVALKTVKKALTIAKEAQEKENYDGVTFLADPNQLSLASLDQVYRVGAKNSSWLPRNLLVSFKDAHHRFILLKTKPFLAEAENINFYLEEDMTSLTRSHRSKLKRIVAAAKDENLDAKIAGNRVFIDGIPYGINDLDTIPTNISSKTKEEKAVEGGIAYRGQESIFSNFYMAPFEVEETWFNCVEQYYQHNKAVACNDLERARKIMICTDPKRMKELGDGVRDGGGWLPNRVPTLYAGVLAKFQQNPDLAIALISSGPMNLYEATTDKFFGCGIGLQSKKWAKKEWIGENVAGRIVMKVRAELTGEAPPATPQLTLDGLDETASPHALHNSPNETNRNMEERDDYESEKNISSNSISNTKRPYRAKGSNPRKQWNYRNHKGHGRGSPRPNNTSHVTERSHRRQSAYKVQLSDKDQDFLSVPKSSSVRSDPDPNMATEITTSTPKSPSNPNTSTLSDSELVAMGIDPNTKYADDVRRKYSSAATNR